MNLLDALPAAAILTACLANAWRDDRRDLYSLRRNARRRAAATAAASTHLHGPGTATDVMADVKGTESAAAVGVAGVHGSPSLFPE